MFNNGNFLNYNRNNNISNNSPYSNGTAIGSYTKENNVINKGTTYGNNFNNYSLRANNNKITNNLSNSVNLGTNVNIFGFTRSNLNSTGNKFVSNVNPGTTMNQQERVINFGHDYNENTFKKILRKPVSNLLQNTSYNILSGGSYSLPSSQNILKSKYNEKFYNNNQNSEKVDDLFYSFNNMNRMNSNSIPQLSRSFQTKKDPIELSSNVAGKSGADPFYFTTYKSVVTPVNKINTVSADQASYTVKDSKVVKEYSYREEQNLRFRNGMEDTSKVVDKFGGDNSRAIFSIYDGHGGADVAKYAKDRIPEILDKLFYVTKDKSRDPNYIESLLTSAFQKVDEELRYINSENVGATATVVFITKEKDNTSLKNYRQVVYCANVGDTRCVLITNYGAKRLSYDHKASDPAEMIRITNSGGLIFGGRVFGQLILTRALGDHALKKHGVTSTPYVNKHNISERDKYIVIASDGVWDVITDDDIYRLHLQITNSDEYASLIVKTALFKGSQDNISCLVLKLN